jgi:iron complex outermembrane receptor protein
VKLGRTGSLTAVVNVMRREAGAPGLPMLGALHARAEQTRTIAGATARVPCSSAELGATGGCELELSSNGLVSRYALGDPAGELGLGGSVENEGRRLGQALSGRAGLSDWLELRWGGRAEQEQLRVDRAGATSLRASRLLSRLELGARAHVERALDVVLSGALECHSTRARGALDGCGVLEPVGRVGVRWQLVEPLSLFANLGRTVRVPTLGELHGTSAVVVGNPELVPERGLGSDLGATLRLDGPPIGLYAQLAGFARFADELIAYRRSSFGVIRPYNVASARVLGLELAAAAKLWQLLELGLSLTALDPRDTSDERLLANDLLPLQSRLVVAPFVELATPPWPAAGIDRAAIGARVGYRSSRLADPAGLVVLDEQGQLDLVASVSLLAERLAVRGSISNLLGAEGVDLVGYPLPGRAAHVEVEAWW